MVKLKQKEHPSLLPHIEKLSAVTILNYNQAATKTTTTY